MPTTLEHTLGPCACNDNYWVRETAYIVNEMLHAIQQSKNPELTVEQREGYDKRAIYLREKAIFCINNAFNSETLPIPPIEEEKE